jgi:hypothetical protein
MKSGFSSCPTDLLPGYMKISFNYSQHFIICSLYYAKSEFAFFGGGKQAKTLKFGGLLGFSAHRVPFPGAALVINGPRLIFGEDYYLRISSSLLCSSLLFLSSPYTRMIPDLFFRCLIIVVGFSDHPGFQGSKFWCVFICFFVFLDFFTRQRMPVPALPCKIDEIFLRRRLVLASLCI